MSAPTATNGAGGAGVGQGGPPNAPPNAEAYYANYAEYSKTLRAWLVAYGIGGPVLLMTNDSASKKLAGASNAKVIVVLFLAGVCLQVLGTAVNKWAAWHVWSKIDEPSIVRGWWSSMWCSINEQTWIDVLVDAASIALFFSATWQLMDTFLKR